MQRGTSAPWTKDYKLQILKLESTAPGLYSGPYDDYTLNPTEATWGVVQRGTFGAQRISEPPSRREVWSLGKREIIGKPQPRATLHP